MHAAALKMSGLTGGGLDGLTLSPAPGALTAVLAPAGAGKTALLQALAGFSRIRGTVELDGHDIARLPAWRRGFGVVSANDALLPHFSLADNVAYPLRLRGLSPAARLPLVAEALHLVQLAGAGGLLPHQATAAQRQRAMLARATVFAPRVLLLDEPFSAQDPPEAAALAVSLRRIHALLGTTTTLLATTHGAQALAVADRIAVLRGGAVEQHGTPEEVFDRPRNAYVAALLGETNHLAGTVEATDDDWARIRLACGPTVEALPGRTLQPGDPCIVSIRPERIAVAAASAAEMGEGALDATLIEAQFEGASYRLRLLIGSGAELVVRRAAAAGLRGLAAGARVALAWQSGHAFAFRQDSAA